MLKRKEIPQQAPGKEKQERRQGKDSSQKSKNHKLMKTIPSPPGPEELEAAAGSTPPPH